jgi:type I restriction enzyme, S subunit
VSELPPGWVSATGHDVFETVTSGSRGWAQHYSDEGAIFVRIGNLDHGTITLDLHDIQHVRPPSGAEGERTRLRPNDVLISITAELGMIGLVPETLGVAYINQHIALARPRLPSEPRFLAWYLASDVDGKRQLQELRRGATKAGLGLDDIRRVEFPLPPLPEQKRIADKLGALLTRVDACRERLNRVPGILKRFRQSVLAAAASGELTQEWRDGLGTDADVGVEHPEVLEERGGWPSTHLPSTWRWMRFTDCFEDATDSRRKLPQSEYDAEGELAVVDQGEVLIGGYTSRADLASRVSLPAIVFGDHTRCVKFVDFPFVQGADGVKVLAPRAQSLLPQYAYLALQACQLPNKGYSRHMRFLRASFVPVPPRDEQAEIVRCAAALLSLIDSLDARVDSIRARAVRLTPSALAKAFRGELVPQDPNDEPGSTLLERLRTRRSPSGTTGKLRRVPAQGSPKAKEDMNMLTRKDVTQTHLTAILRERGALTPEALWTASRLEIDDFYDQLKDEEARGLLRENRGSALNAARLLEPAA